MPYITQVAVGRRSHLNVFGNDYETPDGTGKGQNISFISNSFSLWATFLILFTAISDHLESHAVTSKIIGHKV